MPSITTKIDNCKFPSEYLYDTQNFTWADMNFGDKKTEYNSESVVVNVGLMPVLSYISGKIQKIRLKSEGEIINKGKSFGYDRKLKLFWGYPISNIRKNCENQQGFAVQSKISK